MDIYKKNHIICTKAKLLKWRLETFQEIIKLDGFVKSHKFSYRWLSKKTENNLLRGGFWMRYSKSWIGLTIYSLLMVDVLSVIKEDPRQIAVLEGL